MQKCTWTSNFPSIQTVLIKQILVWSTEVYIHTTVVLYTISLNCWLAGIPAGIKGLVLSGRYLVCKEFKLSWQSNFLFMQGSEAAFLLHVALFIMMRVHCKLEQACIPKVLCLPEYILWIQLRGRQGDIKWKIYHAVWKVNADGPENFPGIHEITDGWLPVLISRNQNNLFP